MDEAGLYADFHALRHSFVSLITQGGVHPKLAQNLARHSDINLTMSRYSDTLLRDKAEALDVLPEFSSLFDGDRPDRQELRTIGTDATKITPAVSVHAESVSTKGSREAAESILPIRLPEKGEPDRISVHSDAVSSASSEAENADGEIGNKPAKYLKNQEQGRCDLPRTTAPGAVPEWPSAPVVNTASE